MFTSSVTVLRHSFLARTFLPHSKIIHSGMVWTGLMSVFVMPDRSTLALRDGSVCSLPSGKDPRSHKSAMFCHILNTSSDPQTKPYTSFKSTLSATLRMVVTLCLNFCGHTNESSGLDQQPTTDSIGGPPYRRHPTGFCRAASL